MLKMRRSTFWVVSTHVLTTGIAMPTVAALVSAAIIFYGDIRHPLAKLAVVVGCALAGYVGGTYYSLIYLDRVAEHERWTACTAPSVIVFAILAILWFAWNATQLRQPNAMSVGALAIFYALIIAVFATITDRGFWRMTQRNTASGDEQQPLPDVASSDHKERRFGRLFGACVGFVAGLVVGLGMAIYLDHAGWQPRNGWQTRFAIALAVGGVGALLGLISGPPRKV